MSVKKIRGLALDAGGNPLPGALVECRLIVDEGTSNATGIVVPTIDRVVADSSGFFFLYKQPNSELQAAGTWYQVTVYSGTAKSTVFMVVTTAVYPMGQDYLDLATLTVAEPVEALDVD